MFVNALKRLPQKSRTEVSARSSRIVYRCGTAFCSKKNSTSLFETRSAIQTIAANVTKDIDKKYDCTVVVFNYSKREVQLIGTVFQNESKSTQHYTSVAFNRMISTMIRS